MRLVLRQGRRAVRREQHCSLRRCDRSTAWCVPLFFMDISAISHRMGLRLRLCARCCGEERSGRGERRQRARDDG